MLAGILLLGAAASAQAVPAAAQPPPAARVLTLEEALSTARTRQPQIRQAEAAFEAADARAHIALAPLLPQVTGGGSYERTTANFNPRPGALPSQVAVQSNQNWNTFDFFSFNVGATQLLYDFGQSWYSWKSSKAGALSQKDSERTTLEQVLFAVRTAFFQARAAKGLVGVATETLANQQKHMEQTQGFVEVGTQPPIALAQAKTDLANARVQLINAQNGYETARAQLNQAMGVEGPTDYDVSGQSPAPVEGEDGTTESLLHEALKARPEMSSLANQVLSEELALRSSEGGYGPSLGLSTALTSGGERASSLTENWNAMITLSVPIFQGGQTRAQIAQTRANLKSARSALDLEQQQVRLDVEQARLAVRAAKAALAASEEALVSAREQLRLAEGRYETGVGSIIELGDAQVASTSAGQQNVQAEYNLAQARAQLVKALGRD